MVRVIITDSTDEKRKLLLISTRSSLQSWRLNFISGRRGRERYCRDIVMTVFVKFHCCLLGAVFVGVVVFGFGLLIIAALVYGSKVQIETV